MDPTIASIIGTITGAIIGAALTGPVTYCFTKKLMRRQGFNRVAAEFRAAFTEEKRLLSKPFIVFDKPKIKAFDIIDRALVKHENATILFRPHICASKITSFNDAWTQYAEQDKQKVPSYPHIQYDSQGNEEREKEIREIILHRINHLLTFAELK